MTRPRIAIWKFSSCDGCQLSLLDLEDELLAVAGAVDVAMFLEASSRVEAGPYDLSLVEGSMSTPGDLERIAAVRAASKTLVAIGACAVGGGVQAQRNGRDVDALVRAVYPGPVALLPTSTPIAAHVPVDYELHGCPVDKHQLLEVVAAHLAGRRPQIRATPVCLDCKQRGTVCVLVARGVPCLGPTTHGGCGALCPTYDRGCYGCFGALR